MNLGLMAYLWLGRCNNDDKRPPFPPRGPFEFIVKQTQMDAEQRSGYEKLRDEHQAAIRPLRREMQEERAQMYEHLNTIHDSTKNSLLNNIALLQRQIDSVTVAHFVDVRKLLRPNQQKTFDDILPEAIRMMSPPPNRPPEEGRPQPEGRNEREGVHPEMGAPPHEGEPPPPRQHP